MNVYVTGSFPAPLFRALKEEQYARDFVEQGKFRLCCLDYYHKIEDEKKRDKSEGEGSFEILGPRPVVTIDQETMEVVSEKTEVGSIYRGIITVSPCYILCFSGPKVDIDYLREKHGQHVVRVNQPDLLVQDIKAYLEHGFALSNTMQLECVEVRYDKDQLLESEPTEGEKDQLSYGQKYPCDAMDFEYRIVCALTLPWVENLPSQIDIELRKKLGYAEII